MRQDARLAYVRTTIDLDPDVTRIVNEFRVKRSEGLSETVNELCRQGALALQGQEREPYVHQASDRGRELIDLTSIGRALDEIEGLG